MPKFKPALISMVLILSVFIGSRVPGIVAPSVTIRVPQDQPTIQAGINAAQSGDLVLVSPGKYSEQVSISGKTITLASNFYTTGDSQFITNTIIDGGGKTSVTVDSSVGPNAQIIGFTIQNGMDGIKTRGKIQILNNRIAQNVDGVDYQDSGGINRNNIYENNSDDGIDLDGASEVTIENNLIRNNGDDGIEIRMQPYQGTTLNIAIRGNTISGNLEDGIQLIDYPDLSHRVFTIEHNLIQHNAMVGLGLMDSGITREDFRAASIPERIALFNNTFADQPYDETGGANLIALNNLFVNATTLALKNVDAASIVAHSLFWNNAANYVGTNIDLNTTRFANPLLNSTYQLQPGSPAIDAGIAHFEWNGAVVLDLPASAYAGTAPDLGTFETNFTPATTNHLYLPIVQR